MTNERQPERVRFQCSASLAETAEREAAAIIPELRQRLPAGVEILHVGATSVSGCLTKGDLDLVVRVDAPDFQAARDALDSAYCKNLGSPRDDTFASYAIEGRSLPVGIQLVVRGSALDDFHSFWERLRASPQLKDEYNALKRQWDGGDMEQYRAAKSDFIRRANAQLPVSAP